MCLSKHVEIHACTNRQPCSPKWLSANFLAGKLRVWGYIQNQINWTMCLPSDKQIVFGWGAMIVGGLGFPEIRVRVRIGGGWLWSGWTGAQGLGGESTFERGASDNIRKVGGESGKSKGGDSVGWVGVRGTVEMNIRVEAPSFCHPAHLSAASGGWPVPRGTGMTGSR